MYSRCQSCGKRSHNFEREEALDCIPPENVLVFGEYKIDKNYRKALYRKHPIYTAEEVVGSFLGYNPYFPSQNEWLEENEEIN